MYRMMVSSFILRRSWAERSGLIVDGREVLGEVVGLEGLVELA
jgi:hypothetical protein